MLADRRAKQPNAFIFAGAGVSGKSTLVAALYQGGFLTADYVEESNISGYIDKDLNFVAEMVFTEENSNVQILHILKEKGYRITLFFVGTNKEEINVIYLLNRVRKHGEDSSVKNLVQQYDYLLYSASCLLGDIDEFIIVDNSIINKEPIVLSMYLDGKLAYRKEDYKRHIQWLFWVEGNGQNKAPEEVNPSAATTVMKIEKAISLAFLQITSAPAWDVSDLLCVPRLKEGELKAVLRNTTNSGLLHYKDILGSLYISTISQWIGAERDCTFHTSALVDVVQNDYMLMIKTLNSVYQFEVIIGVYDPFFFTKADENIIKEQEERNSTRYTVYFCQIIAPGMLNQSISVVHLPVPMNREEVVDYVSSNSIFDVNGCLVQNILSPNEEKI